MKKKLWITLLLIVCILPALILSTGKFTVRKPGGFSTMGVIIGPIVLPEDMIPEEPAENEWSSSTGVVRQTAYTDGGLKAFSSLYVVNDKFNSSNGDFKYSSFVKYFKIVRTDGRVIYDDDGVLDVRWWKNGVFTESDEIVDYAADIYVKTQVLNYNYKGFLGTILNAKFKSGAKFIVTWDGGEDPWDSQEFSVHDKNANNMGSGNYRNNGVNPGPEYYKLCSMDYCNAPYVTIELSGTGYWENGWWGGSYDYVDINSFMSGFMPRSNRNWSNTLKGGSAAIGTYQGATAYYSPKAFTAVATNLNNFIKLNGVQATPTYGSTVAPYKDGHHISISDEGYTFVEIENGGEKVYTPYYCFVDTKLPDVSYTYHNGNALDTRKVGTITTGSTGAKTQTINEGVFKDEVQVNFGYDSATESPETATYTLNGKTYSLSPNQWLKEEGDYTVTIKDLSGHTTISKFTIDKSAPNYNLGRLENDTTYKVGKWYLTSIPYGYTGYGTYSFKDYDDALALACDVERQNCVTNYVLNNIADFKNTHLVANGNTIKTGNYWYYKSKENPDLYVYYFDENSLNNAIEHYAKNYVSDEQVYRINSSITPNNYGNTLDESMYDNIISSGGIDSYIGNKFIFKQTNTNESYKIFCDYQEDNTETWKELQYNIAFEKQLTSHGLYKIKEIDYVGHETYYYVFLDLQAPLLDVEAKIYGKETTINQTISVNDIPNNGELIFYYEKFNITKVIEDDLWWALEVKCPDGSLRRYTYLDEISCFDELGSGEFNVTVADRVGNSFKFTVILLGKAPEVKFESINTNSQVRITISSGEKYNKLTDIKIYRNNICLNSENGYDEFPDRTDDSLIFIDTNTLKYIFNRGGLYKVELTDNFGRILTFEYTFEKEIPVGILVGVDNGGKTKDMVQFLYDSNKYFVVVSKDNISYTPQQATNNNITTLVFNPEENTEIYYSIQLVEKTDTENYNIYHFTIKTIKPNIVLVGVEPNGTTGGNVYATWEVIDEQYTAHYSLNGNTTEYRKGQLLSVEGLYTITLQDEIGNENSVSFEIDKSISFIIADNKGKQYTTAEIEYINFDIKVIAQEPLGISVTRNDNQYDYEFGLMLSEEGTYIVKMFDEFGNSTFFTFTIDKTAPIATLYGVENFGVTNERAWVTSMESGLTCWTVRNQDYINTYKLGTELTQSGHYKVFVSDKANNITSFEFEIDKSISFEINVYNGGISNGGVRIIAYENLRVVMYKDSQIFDYQFEQILKDEGEYSFTLFDDLGNKFSSYFTIITKKKQNLKHLLQENISVVEVIKDDVLYDFEITENELYLYDEGSYKVKVLDEQTNKEYTFEIGIDTTPPTLELVNVENGGSTKKIVKMQNVSEQPYELIVYVDGIIFDYKLGDEIEKSGRFEVYLYDEAGNKTTYTFERIYSLNAASIAVIAGLGALVVLLIILLIKSRHHYYRDEVIEEEIEETIIEDDFIDDNNSNSDENLDNQ